MNRERREPQERDFWDDVGIPCAFALMLGAIFGAVATTHTPEYSLGLEARDVLKGCEIHYRYEDRACELTAQEIKDPNEVVRQGGTYWGNNPKRGSSYE